MFHDIKERTKKVNQTLCVKYKLPKRFEKTVRRNNGFLKLFVIFCNFLKKQTNKQQQKPFSL